MRVTNVLCVPTRAGFFADDQRAIAANSVTNGFTYIGSPLTPGFGSVREAGQAVSVLLVLEDGQVAHGDCAAVQYSGVGGRDPVFDAESACQVINEVVTPLLRGSDITQFRGLAERVDGLAVNARPIHTAIRYGVTQAILDAAARARAVTMAEVVRDEYSTGIEIAPVPLFTQSGDDRYNNVDKMILKGADVLPHGLVNNVETKLGSDGEVLTAYVKWVRDRVLELRTSSRYSPVLHFDLYGTVGDLMGPDVAAIADYLTGLADLAEPFATRFEHVIDAGSRDAQIEVSARLRAALRARGSRVQIAVDEWCNTLDDIRLFVEAQSADMIHVKTPDLGGINNTIEALLLVRDHGLDAYCGGTCNETDRSAQISAHIAMACGAGQVLAKPGMGVDEGMMIVGNEMARVAALVATRPRTPGSAL